MAPTYKNYVFTWNNPTATPVYNPESMHYLIYQLERGESGTVHYQGYLELKRRVALTTAKQFLDQSCHLEPRRGTRSQAIAYCKKDDSRVDGPWEFGEAGSTQGKRSDIKEFKDWFFSGKRSLEECVEEHPDVVAKYPRFLSTLTSIVRKRNLPTTPFTPNPGWQAELAEYLSTEPDRRKITWIYDEIGGNGKSYFALNYRSEIEPFICTGGRFGDIFYSYVKSGTPNIVFFDWPRDHEDRFPYGLLESFKNGYFLSTKYECETVRFQTPHVIVFANFPPDQTKLSFDRWIIKRI